MRIALLTYNIGQNYGGILQAYALMTTLSDLGHSPELLYIKTGSVKGWKRLIKKYILSKFMGKFAKRESEYKKLHEFVEEKINPKTKPLSTKKDFLRVTKNNYDAYVVGSDQVWRARLFRYIDYAFFGFVETGDPIFFSYAPSFGVETWDYTEAETLKFREQLAKFRAVSVREDSGVELCRKYLNRDATHVLDPTALLDKTRYLSLLDNSNAADYSGELLTYILDESDEKNKLVDIVSKDLSYDVFKVGSINTDSERIEDMVYPSVQSWIEGFNHAKFVITDSFHGCIFSILFHKPFIVYGNRMRGLARFNSVLKMVGLENRMIASLDDVDPNLWLEEVDWESVDNKLNVKRNISFNFLRDALSGERHQADEGF
ncbi:polysaccharide pyruvyl transferase family protein [Pseudodesulfovibrio methanolicus]|uniref:Polysaccharide pyruvyl transferase family protein n=1 Tax=Pseudodesulfovibrio methanolicus TaxID=3126690 RepID=A0ABZ2ITC1_9BACT